MTSASLGDDSPPGRRGAAAAWALAAALYLVTALFALRVVLPSPRTLLPYSAHLEGASLAIDETDQQFVVASVARMAERVGEDPARLFDNGQCFPMARPVTLGEHMIGEGLLGAVPEAVWNDPILTYNVVLLLELWIPGLTMFALVRALTGRSGPALVAGFLFAFLPGRIGDPVHPFVHADLWTPLALLGAHRLFTRRRWRDALLLGAALVLQAVESLYTLIALAIVGGVYGTALLVRFRAHLARVLPKLALAALPVIGTALAIFVPYLHTRATWGVLEGRGALLFQVKDFVPGAFYYPGTVLTLLALAGLADRVRGPRPGRTGYDPRLPLAIAAGLVFWTVIWGIRIPGTDVLIPSPFAWASARVPGLRAVRAIPAIRFGLYLALAVLAGYGTLVLQERIAPRARRVVAAALVACAAAEVFVPALNAASAGVGQVRLATRHLAPFPAVRRLGDAFPPGAVLDLPFRLDVQSRLTDMAHFIFRGAYHERPVAACYNSFTVPIFEDVGGIAARVPDAGALAELWALGFRTVQLHDELLEEGDAAALGAALAGARTGPVHLAPIGRVGAHHAWRIAGTPPVTTSPDALVWLGSETAVVHADTDYEPPVARVRLRFRNATPAIYRQPDPIVPVRAVVRWRPADGGAVVEEERRLLPPIALAPGRVAVRPIALETPAPAGRWRVTIAAAAEPARPLASLEIVAAPAEDGDA